MPNCLRLSMQLACAPLFFAADKTGNSSAAKIAMMAITISNSMSVKPVYFTETSFTILLRLHQFRAYNDARYRHFQLQNESALQRSTSARTLN